MKLLFLFLIPLILTAYEGENANVVREYPALRFTYGNHSINRPLFHFTPTYGWMNDPNGCFYDKKEQIWHLYFQYNPQGTTWGTPLYWGHAISKDLNTWKQQPNAIGPPNDKDGVFSGSIYIDSDNLSGFFSDDVDKDQRIIAMWTYNYDDTSHHQNQWLSFSTDKGYTFTTPPEGVVYEGKAINPVASTTYNNGTDIVEQMDFRDPQVIKYFSTAKNSETDNSTVDDKKFIMTVAESQQYVIHFYQSDNGVHFEKKGSYAFGGFLGHQYECPNMCHLKNVNKTEGEEDSYWVLFVSINPGAFLGGSSTWYVIGQFKRENGIITDNFVFQQTQKYLNIFDYGKDFYAMQLYFVNPDNETILKEGYETVTGITWASNWQYSGIVPTDPWRSSMTIPREFALSHFHLNGQVSFLTLRQRPVLNHANFSPSIHTLTPTLIEPLYSTSPNRIIDFSEGANGAFEFFLDFQLHEGETATPEFYMLLRGGSLPEEYIKFGYNDNGPVFYIDRGHSNVEFVKNNGAFTHHISLFSEHLDYRYNLYGLIDRNIIEVFLNVDNMNTKTSYVAATNTFFFTGGNFVSTVEFVPITEGRFNIAFYGRQLTTFDYTE